ncbi:hypothetical protein HZA45_02905 [Candidatus Peregrinibacteria bacterium]|nr:hypothetical protein [Candidatus Peregrinibacteria bacterium]
MSAHPLPEEPMNDLLRRLGADPDNPPPKPENMNIDVGSVSSTDLIRGPVTMTICNRERCVTFKLMNIDADAALDAERIAIERKMTTTAQMIELLQFLSASKEESY